MADNRSQATVNMSSVETMTITELRNAKKIIEKKLEENKDNAFLSEKLTNILYTYEKKEKDINNFYRKCINHKNPKVVSLVSGKRHLLRAMDIKRVSRNGKLRDLIYKSKNDTLDYGFKDYLKEHTSDIALGAGIAAMGAGVASINFGDVSLISLIKQALTKMFTKNAVASALFMSGATLIAVGLSAKLIKKKVQHIKNRQNMANKVQNEISNEMNKDLPDLDPDDLKGDRFKSAKGNIVKSLYNSPALLSMYEEALRQPQKYGLSAIQRLNLVEALKEAYSQIDDLDRVRRGEPTKAELAAINKQKAQDKQNYDKCKNLISKFNTSVEALSEKSEDKDFSALKTQIDSIKSTISLIKDEKSKSELIAEVETASKQFKTKTSEILKNRENQDKTIANEVNTELDAVSKKIDALSKEPKKDELIAIENAFSSLEQKVNGIASSKLKSDLTSKVNSIKEKFESAKDKINVSKTEEEKKKTKNEMSDQKILDDMNDQKDKILEHIKDYTGTSDLKSKIENGIEQLKEKEQKVVTEEYKTQAKAILDEVNDKYNKKVAAIAQAKAEEESKKTNDEKEYSEISKQLSSLIELIKNEKGSSSGGFAEDLKGIRTQFEGLKERIKNVSNFSKNTKLQGLCKNVETELKYREDYYDVKTKLDNLLKECDTIDGSTCVNFGVRLGELGQKVYSMDNISNQCYYERVECVYMKKLASIKNISDKDYEPYIDVNLKVYRLNYVISYSKIEKTLKYESEINDLINLIEVEYNKLPKFRSRYSKHLENSKKRYAEIKNTINKESKKKGNAKEGTGANEQQEIGAKEDQLRDFYLEIINNEFDVIKDSIRNLNHENCSKKSIEKIENKIKEFENWDIVDESEIENNLYQKDNIAVFDKLKDDIKKKAQELSDALQDKEKIVNKISTDINQNNKISKEISEKLNKLESFFADSNVSTVLKNDAEISELIVELNTYFNSTKEEKSFTDEKARLAKVEEEYGKINESLNLDYKNYLLEEVEARMSQFKDELSQVNATTLYEHENSLSDKLESMRPLVEKVKLRGNVDGKGNVGMRFAQLEAEYNKTIKKYKKEVTKLNKGDDNYRKDQTIDVGKKVGEERDIELLKQKVRFGMADYIKSISLAEADAKVGVAYSNAVDNLRKFIVAHFHKSGVTDVIAAEMFDRKTGKFIGSENFSYINTNYDENSQSELNNIKKQLAYYVKEAEEKHKLKNKLHDDNYNIVIRILKSNLGRSRVVLINEISKKLNIDKQEATKLVGENGELLGEAAKLKDDPRIIDATRNFDRDNGELDSYNRAYNEYYEARKKYNDSNDKYERVGNLQEYNEKRSILDIKCKAVREKILENLRLDYDRVKEKSGKEVADAGFLLGCREIGKDPKEIAKIIRLEDVNFELKTNKVLNDAKQKSVAQAQAKQEEQNKENAQQSKTPKQETKTPEELDKLKEQYRKSIIDIYAKYGIEYRDTEEFKALCSEAIKVMDKKDFIAFRNEVISQFVENETKEKIQKRGEKPSMKEQIDQINSILKEYEQISLEIKKAQIDLERLQKRGVNEQLLEQKTNQTSEIVKSKEIVLASKSKMLDDIIESIRKIYGNEAADRLIAKINDSKNKEYTEDMIYPKTMTKEEHKARIEKKIDYVKSIVDDPDLKEKCLEGLLKTIIRACDEYSESEFQEYLKVYEELNSNKEEFGKEQYDEYAEIFELGYSELQENVIKDDKNKIQKILSNFESTKQTLISRFGNDSKYMKQLLEEISNKSKQIQIEYKDPNKGFDENDNIMTLEECEQGVVALLAEFDEKKQIVNGQYRKDTTTVEIENRLKNYFIYAEKRFGRGSLAMLKHKTHEKVSGENLVRGDVRVQTLKEMFDGVQKDAKFSAFLKAYQALYAAIESGNQERIAQLNERLQKEETNFSDIELEVIKKFIDVATVAKDRALASKEQGNEKKFTDEFIVELFEKGFDEKKIRELTGNKLSEKEIKEIIGNAKQAQSME